MRKGLVLTVKFPDLYIIGDALKWEQRNPWGQMVEE